MTDAETLDRVRSTVAPLAPVTFTVPLRGSVAIALYSYAMESGVKAETVIAEAVAAYLGDAR